VLSVILAGGVGERFWPQSRRQKPKQLINLTGGGTMISLTVDRVRWVSEPEEIFVVTIDNQREAIVAELGGVLPAENVIGEPVGRNTAPCIGVAALLIKQRFGDVPFMVLPADHLVEGRDKYEAAVRVGTDYVDSHDCLLTFGITPSRPETGYGYIRAGERLSRVGETDIFEAHSFHEKPSQTQAQQYLDQGCFFWNSGMFCWRAGSLLNAISRHEPELYHVLTDIEARMGTEPLEAVLKSTYPLCPSISIDYAVMEKADNVVVLRSDFYWNDVGSWESIREVYPGDAHGNVLVGEHLLVDSTDNTIFSPDRSVGMIGLSGVVVVDGGDSILVCARDEVQRVREIVDILRIKRKDELL